jgi:hypothetical protein
LGSWINELRDLSEGVFKANGIVCENCVLITAVLRDNEEWRRCGDAGSGVCLGLRMLHDEKKLQGPDLGHGLVKVDYCEASWRENVKEHMGQVCAFLSHRHASDQYEELALSALYRIAAFTSIMAKNQNGSLSRSSVTSRLSAKVPMFSQKSNSQAEKQSGICQF